MISFEKRSRLAFKLASVALNPMTCSESRAAFTACVRAGYQSKRLVHEIIIEIPRTNGELNSRPNKHSKDSMSELVGVLHQQVKAPGDLGLGTSCVGALPITAEHPRQATHDRFL